MVLMLARAEIGWGRKSLSQAPMLFPVHVSVSALMCTCIWGTEVNLRYNSSGMTAVHLVPSGGVSHQSGTCQVDQAGWPVSPKDLPSCFHLPIFGITSACHCTYVFIRVLRSKPRPPCFCSQHLTDNSTSLACCAGPTVQPILASNS